MQLTLKREDVVEALKGHIHNMGFDLTNKFVDIVFVAGRKDNGLTATVTITAEAPLKPSQGILRAVDQSQEEALASTEFTSTEVAQVAEDTGVYTKAGLFGD